MIAVEQADVLLSHKPWGSLDLRPWNARNLQGDAVGEIWFQRSTSTAPEPALLLKLLFTNEPLSIQVHPDDNFARSIGLPHGKTEAWYILAATPNAKVALGLKRRTTAQSLRVSIENGSIADLILWLPVEAGDVVYVPAGTVHAIGPGLVIAEIQQRSNATFRLFDYHRQRELHVADAVAVADCGPASTQPASRRLTDTRTLLIESPYFVLERIDIRPDAIWEMNASSETWLLALGGSAQLGSISLSLGEALFLEADRVTISANKTGLSCLVAYQGSEPSRTLIRALPGPPVGLPLT